jgi:site-specific recombinase XerD
VPWRKADVNAPRRQSSNYPIWNIRYCSEPRLAFNRTVVTRYRIALEQHPYAPSTINLRLAAIRRLAYEASDCGLLSPDLAAGIRRVKGVRRLGVRVGNWLTAEEGKKLLAAQNGDTLRGRRNRALLSLLIGCGLRRAEGYNLKVGRSPASGRPLGHR